MYRKAGLFSLLIFLFACSTPNLPLSMNYKGYRITKQAKPDTALSNLLQPYSVQINSTMNKVIGFSNTTMYKKQPESILGNFMADCIQKMAAIKYEKSVDVGFMNQGGIRAEINKGNITLGNIYELMPFDNLVVIQQVKGADLEKFIQHIAADGGWPISANSSFKIKAKKAIDIVINGKPLDVNAVYTVSNTDYIANGGSNSDMFKGIPMQNKGYLLRDALVEYINLLTKQGKPVDGKLENRVTISNE
ncbi:MAG: 5'-nucleotidase [Sediminibacterium sp.]|nr:5'-nucleotidase [Sediminibacterium sp.]